MLEMRALTLIQKFSVNFSPCNTPNMLLIMGLKTQETSTFSPKKTLQRNGNTSPTVNKEINYLWFRQQTHSKERGETMGMS